MAKIKVSEIAEELNITVDEVKGFFKEKGIEVKRSNSSLEEEQANDLRASYQKGAPADAKTEKAAKPVKPVEEKVAEPAKTAEAKAAEPAKKEEEKKPQAREQEQEPPKKKKNIIFVSNPHNSQNTGRRPQGGGNGNGGGRMQDRSGSRPGGMGQKPMAQQQYRPIKPTIKPGAIVQTPKPQPQMQQGKPKTKPENIGNTDNETLQSAPARETVRQENDARGRGGNYSSQNNGERRPYNNEDGRKRYGDRDRRPAGEGDRRPIGERQNSGAGRTGGQGNGYSQGRGNGAKPFGNNERDQGGNGRPQNRPGKNQGGKSFGMDAPMQEPEKKRDDEKRRLGQERDKRSKKDHIYEDDNQMLLKNKNKAGRFIKPEKKQEEPEEQIKVITIPETITIKDLADKMKLQPSAIVKKLFMQGKIVTVNQEVDFETAEEIAIEYEIICEKEVQVDVIEELLKEDEEEEAVMEKRPPVICVMGHVDHGKTSLLDAIRKTNVTDREAGGITQHIGAYTVKVGEEKITFLDTPGHEAFTAMRMRGASSTDIAILVVAADDGVMPQTVEAINHAKAAGIEIIVAVNKIDKPNANIDRVKQELTEYELIPVDWGGSTEFVPVSAKSGEGIDTLLETIILTAEILELKANPNRKARGLVIEAELDKGRGPVATILVQKGTLHVGDFISAGAAHGKVRAMVDDKGRRVKEATPSTPVEILGLSDVPNAGEIFIAHDTDKIAKSFAETFVAQNKQKKLEETKAKMSLDDLFSKIQEGNLKELNLIIKADVQGSVEAVKQSLLKLSNDEVVVKCIHGGVGAINESDVILASASSAIIIGFNVRPDAMAKATAEREGVDVRLYKVIYQAIEDVEAAMKGMLDPIFEEQVIGHAEVRQIFKASAVGNIAGSYVLDGRFERNCSIRISREGEQIFEGKLASLKRFKDDVKEVKAGYECGLVFEGFDQMQELDIVEAYIMVEVPR